MTPVPNGLPEILQYYGDPYEYIGPDGSLSPLWETNHITRVVLPAPIPYAVDHDVMIRKVACHQLIATEMATVFQTIFNHALWYLLTSYGGGYNPRAQKGSHKWSTHTWGLAVDLNVETNRQRSVGDMDPRIIEIFKDHGFMWGGEWKGRSRDPMHFQRVTGY